MRPPSKIVFAAASAVILLSLPAIDRAQDPLPVLAVENPFHAFEKYDYNVAVTLTGTVTRVDWTNPLVRIDLDARDAAGKVTKWSVQGYPPATLTRAGFQAGEVKTGDLITIAGYKNRDGSNTAGGQEIILADGKRKLMGPTVSMLVPSPFAGQNFPGAPNPNAKDDPFHTYESPAQPGTK